MTTAPDRRILVGVDGSPESRAALHWAAEQARRSHRGLCVLHAADIDWLVAAALISRPEEHHDTDDVVDAAVEHLENRYPDVDVVGRVTTGAPAHDLVQVSSEAHQVVIGAHGSSPSHVVLGNVAHAVAMHAACPVVVVRDEDAGGRDGPVVVGVDGSPTSVHTVELALDEAALRGTSVVAVHAWWLEVVDGFVVTTPGSSAWQAAEKRLQDEVGRTLDAARGHRPDVELTTRLVRGRPADVLVEASRTAPLVVVGARGRGGFAGLLLGSVSREVLMRAEGPVAVARLHRR